MLRYGIKNKIKIDFGYRSVPLRDSTMRKSYAVSGHKRMWSVTNYYLLNLTLADIMMATLNCIFSFNFMRDGYI